MPNITFYNDQVPTIQGTRGVTTAAERCELLQWKLAVINLRAMGNPSAEDIKLAELEISAFVKTVSDSTCVEAGYQNSEIFTGNNALNHPAWNNICNLAIEAGVQFDEGTQNVFIYITCAGRCFVWGGGVFGFTTLDTEGSEGAFQNFFMPFVV